MNCATKLKAVLMDSQKSCPMMQRRVALFHSTPILDSRRKRDNWNYDRSKYYKSKNKKRLYPKQGRVLLCNLLRYEEYAAQGWESVFGDYDFSRKGSARFRSQFGPNGPNMSRPGNKGTKNKGKRGFQFVDDEVVETIFQSMFGRSRCSFWDFVDEENPQRSSYYNYTNFRDSWNWGDQFEDKYDSYTEPDYTSEPDLTSARKALGLTVSGPLKLEEVKKAYRASALKWHPDRHQGSSKVAAEEKFKVCSTAYDSLCDRLALN